jgi:hypothetical protein
MTKDTCSPYRSGHSVLVLEDPGGEPLDRLLDRPLQVTEFLQIAIPLTRAVRGVHDPLPKYLRPAPRRPARC